MKIYFLKKANAILLILLLNFYSLGIETSSTQRVLAQTSVPSIATVIAWNPAATQLAIGYNDGRVAIQDGVSGQNLFTLLGHTDEITSLSWSPSGTQLASGSKDNSLRLWRAASGQVISILQSTEGEPITLTWSPDGLRLASVSELGSENALRIWNTQTAQLLGAYTGFHPIGITWSPNGQKLAGALAAQAVRIIDSTTFDYHTAVDLFLPPGESVYSVAWSKDGSKIAGGAFNGIITVWDTATQQLLYRLAGSTVQNPKIYDATIRGLAFSNDGSRLVSISQDGTLSVWDIATGQHISQTSIGQTVTVAALSPDGSKIAYIGTSGDIPKASIPL